VDVDSGKRTSGRCCSSVRLVGSGRSEDPPKGTTVFAPPQAIASLSLSQSLDCGRVWKWNRVSRGRGLVLVLFPRGACSFAKLRSTDFGPESAHAGERKRWPSPAPWLVHGLPHRLNPSYGIWASFVGPDGSDQYQLLSWFAFRLCAIFRLVISLSFSSLVSLLGLQGN
jgi:hypothetical protein